MMSESTLPNKTTSRLSSLIKDATFNSQHVPGLVFQVVDRHGRAQYSSAAGMKGLGIAEPMTSDTVFWIASCTKMISAVALMILVEQGRAELDSADVLEEVLPELKDVPILSNGKLRPKVNRITLRMLMTHTAGLSYSFYNDDIWEHHLRQDPSKDEFQGREEAIRQPLVYEPGESRDYSVGIDWVGIFIERRAGTMLEEFMKSHIFQPLGMNSTSFVPSSGMRSRMAGFHQREESGRLVARPHFYGPARNEMEGCFQSAGAGLLTTVADYCRVLSMILNNGACPYTEQRILAPETIDKMFQNQVPDYMKYVGPSHPVSRSDLVVPPQSETVPVTGYFGWGLNFELEANPESPDATVCEKIGFPRASATGLCNTFWSLDREKGIAAVCFTQILPFGDPYVYPLWQALQDVIYED